MWLKTAKKTNQSLVSGANNSNFNELIMWFPSSQIFQPYLTEYQNGSFSITDISDDNWHHLVWTRNGTENCLYRDKVLQNCITHNASAIDIGSLILGQEQDNYGGGFDSSQALEGLIDELIIFDGPLSSDEITDIFDNQNAGLGYDGSARTCPVLSPVLDMNFDENSYTGPDALLDSSGNNYHGTANNVSPVAGLLCNAADLSADATTDYITMNASAMDGLSDFTVAGWGKTTATEDSTILSGLKDSSAQGSNEAVLYFNNNNEFWPTISDSPFDTATQLGTTVNLNDGQWHQLVWTRQANTAQSCFYFDGVNQGCITHPDSDDTAALQIASLILGQEQDSFGGGFELYQNWQGLLDELVIFNTVLSETQINTMKNNVQAKKHWDGSTRNCDTIPVAQYRFDELQWDGSAGEVKDDSGNDLHLTSYNASTENSLPVISGSPGFCRYGEFNGINSYLQIEAPSNLVGFSDTFSVTTWINPDVLPTGSNLKTILSKDANYEFHLNASGEIFWWWGGGAQSLTTSGANITPDTWYHLAIVYRNGEQRIYINGNLKGTNNTPGTLTLDNHPLQIGQDQGFPGRYFDGSIDEVRIFDRFLSQADVTSIMADTRDCGSVIDHYRIEHDGAGLTCEAETITIKACEDSSCINLYGSSTTLDFKADGVTQSTPTFTGSTTVNLSQTTVDTLTLSVDNETVAASNPLVCINSGGGSDCDIAFAEAGFKFLYGSTNTLTIPTQVAGNNFSDSLKLQAVKDNNGVCTGLFAGNINVDLAQQSISPGNISTLEFKINGNNIGKNNSSVVNTYTNVQLNFGANSIATIPSPLYEDAGQIKLHAKYNVGGVSLLGSTDNAFWVRPDKLLVTAQNEDFQDLNGNSVSSTRVHTAGETFNLNVSAINSDGDVTPNYSPGQIEFKLERAGPTSGDVEGSLTYAMSSTINTNLAASVQYQNVNLTSFSSGTSIFSGAEYNEVGLLKLDLRDSNYGNSSILVDGDEIDIGRFIPDHFTRLTSDTEVQCSSFNYMGQPFKVNYDIAARSVDKTITQNYIDDFAKGVVSLHIENEGANYKNAGYFGSRLSVQVPSPTWQLGHTILTGDDTATLAKAATPDGHFNMADIIMTIIDSDGVEFIADDLDQNPTLPNPSVYTGTKLGSTIDLRYGRLILENSYGSELEDILVPLKAEYWDYIANEFKSNTSDSCTGYLQANLNPLTPNDLHVVLGVDGTLTSGGYPISSGLSLERSNVVKSVEVEYSVPAYLQFDWKGDSSQLNPRATIQFGRYRGNDRVIYWREQ